MKVHEFYHKFANTRLEDRFTVLNFNEAGMTTLSGVFKELEAIGDAMRPLEIRQENLLKLAEEGFKNIERKRGENK